MGFFLEAFMGSIKRKSVGDPIEEPTPPLKQQRENGLMGVDEPVACVHDVSYPEGYLPRYSDPSSAQENSKPAKEFPFTLDPFQSEAIKCLDIGESVMVLFLITKWSINGSLKFRFDLVSLFLGYFDRYLLTHQQGKLL